MLPSPPSTGWELSSETSGHSHGEAGARADTKEIRNKPQPMAHQKIPPTHMGRWQETRVLVSDPSALQPVLELLELYIGGLTPRVDSRGKEH